MISRMWNLKNKANEYIQNKQTHGHKKQVYDYQKEWERTN